MAGFNPKFKKAKSVKDILMSPEFMAQRERTARYVKHEFQDYAYRLASDLGDIGHKAIYMGLAKRENRMMLEQAAAFAMGYFKEINKGKIFMWKLQQLKIEAQRRKDKENLDPAFILKRMAQAETELADVFAAKQKSMFNQQRENLLSKFSQMAFMSGGSAKRAPKIWVFNSGIGLDVRYLQQLGFGITASDISPAMVKRAKGINKDTAITRKLEVLDNKFKPESFNGIWCTLWPYIALEIEDAYLAGFAEKLKAGGTLFIELILGPTEQQQWQEFEWQKDIHIRFEKVNSEENLLKKLAAAGFNLVERTHIEKGRYMLALTLSISDKQ